MVVNPIESSVLDSSGTSGWGGAASTYFWADPSERMAVVFMTQLLPSSTFPIRRELKTLVNQAISLDPIELDMGDPSLDELFDPEYDDEYSDPDIDDIRH